MAHFGFRFIPISLALTSCVIYLCVIAVGWLAIISITKVTGYFELGSTPWGWIAINTVIFCCSFALAWRILMPKVS